MNKLKNIISVIKLIVKYSAVVMAVIKGIQIVSEELDKIDFSDEELKIDSTNE